MKKINAKFASKCAETGSKIAKGEEMYYDRGRKKCYCMASKVAEQQEALPVRLSTKIRQSTAQFASKCAETGNDIAKGETMYYDYGRKKCYCMASKVAEQQETLAADPQRNNQDAALVQAQEDAYFDRHLAR